MKNLYDKNKKEMKKVKVRIEVDSQIEEDEVIIKCKELTKTVQTIQENITKSSPKVNLVFYQNNVEYYLPLNAILFFETTGNGTEIDAHTENDLYKIKHKLYELEELLPNYFIRASKSMILNVNHIYSIEKNLTASSIVQFKRTHKQVYVSRKYYKQVKEKIMERRMYHEE